MKKTVILTLIGIFCVNGIVNAAEASLSEQMDKEYERLAERNRAKWQARLDVADKARQEDHFAKARRAYGTMANPINARPPEEMRQVARQRLKDMDNKGEPNVDIFLPTELNEKREAKQTIENFQERLKRADDARKRHDYKEAAQELKDIISDKELLYRDFPWMVEVAQARLKALHA